MENRIEEISAKNLIGMHTELSLIETAVKTRELWQRFMPRRNEVLNRVPNQYLSMQVYDNPLYFKSFSPTNVFTKWAAVEVESLEKIPEGMEPFSLPGGKYAVFIHKGPASAFFKSNQYIFQEWLPKSGYIIDDRPHFELLEDNYNPTDPNAQEEIWIPIKEA